MSAITNEQILRNDQVNAKGFQPDLRTALQEMTTAQVRHIQLFYKEPTKLDFSKKTALDKAVKDIANGKKLFATLSMVESNIFTFFTKCCEEPQEITGKIAEFIDLLLASGLVFVYKKEESYVAYVTKDVIDVYKGLDLEKLAEIQEKNCEYYNIVLAAVHLYGAISLEDLLTVCKKYQLETTKDTLEGTISAFLPITKELFCENDIVAALMYQDDPEELETLQEAQKSLPRYVPGKKEDFLRYVNNNYSRRVEASRDLENFFREINPDKVAVRSLMASLRLDQQISSGMENSVYTIHYTGFFPKTTEEQLKMLFLLEIMDSYSRKWIYNGFCLQEMNKKNPNKYPLTKSQKVSSGIATVRSKNPIQVVDSKNMTPVTAKSTNTEKRKQPLLTQSQMVEMRKNAMVQQAKQVRKAQQQKQIKSGEASKNSLCSCGSGKKHKRCCGKENEEG